MLRRFLEDAKKMYADCCGPEVAPFMIEGEALNYLHHDLVRAPSILSVDQGMSPAAAGLKLSDRALQMGLILGRLERIGINVKRYAALANHFPQIEAFLKALGDKEKREGNFLFQGARVVLVRLEDVSAAEVVSLIAKPKA